MNGGAPLRFAEIVSPSYVDGPGKRAALFVQGCSIRCPGCQNRRLWPSGAGHGHPASPQALAEILVETGLPVTVTGGEPFDQPEGLRTLMRHLNRLDPQRHVILYSGYTFGELVGRRDAAVWTALALADVLVDGRYVRGQDDPLMQYRGSRNQRAIDLPATLRGLAAGLLCKGPALLGWDQPELIVTDEGDLLGASPLVAGFAGVGAVGPARRCGEAGG